MASKGTSLSYHPQKGYRLQIGYYVTAQGSKSGKVRWFGRIDPREADFQASLIRRLFQEDCQDGVWTAEATARGQKIIANHRSMYELGLSSSAAQLEGAGMIVVPGPAPSPVAKRAT